jgi:multiple antibiotic resistance protein
MFENAGVALATLFTTIGPFDVAAVFAALTSSSTPVERRSYAVRGILIASAILATFALAGDFLLASFGISMAALRTAGGVLLLLIGIDMVFARSSGASTTTSEEINEAKLKLDISVFPLATPLIAGPGTMGAIILLMADAQGNVSHQASVLLALLAIMLFTLVALLTASQINRFLGVTGIQVIMRVSGILLTSLAVQYIFDGISQSGLLVQQQYLS